MDGISPIFIHAFLLARSRLRFLRLLPVIFCKFVTQLGSLMDGFYIMKALRWDYDSSLCDLKMLQLFAPFMSHMRHKYICDNAE